MANDLNALESAVREAQAEVERIELWFALGGTGETVPKDELERRRGELEKALAALADAMAKAKPAPMLKRAAAPGSPVAGDMSLGKDTTGLQATVMVRMNRLATGMAHLYAFRKRPLVTVKVENTRAETARVAVHCRIEGYSAEAIESAEILGKKHVELDLFPPLFPERVATIHEMCAASLHVRVHDLDSQEKGTELIQARPIALLPPTTAILGYLDPKSGKPVDDRDQLAAWVTPNAPEILELLRTAVDFSKLKQMLGYQTDAAGVREHVRAIYKALEAAKVRYVDSPAVFGGVLGQKLQRIRLPRQSLTSESANCVEGAVLMASILEATGIDPLIVMTPGHAYLAYRPDPKQDNYEYVDPTVIGKGDFKAAMDKGVKNTAEAKELGSEIKYVDVRKVRAAGITPME